VSAAGLLALAGLAVCAATRPQPDQPQVFGIFFSVDSTGDAHDAALNGLCETATGACTLRAALEEVNARHSGLDTIGFSIPSGDPGCSGGVCTISPQTALPNITTAVTITGPGADKLKVLASPTGRVFTVAISTPAVVNISSLTITNGQTVNDTGAGVANTGSGTLNISSCVVSNNSAASYGGGVYNATSGTINITNTLLTDNFAGKGGGAVSNGNGTGTPGPVNISGSTLQDNQTAVRESSSGIGGGAIMTSGPLVINSSTITNNYGMSGGGIYAYGGSVSVTNSAITNNFADNSSVAAIQNAAGGGGIYNFAATVNVTNSTIADNATFQGCCNFGGGGGILNDQSGILNVTNSTIAGNSMFGATSTVAGGGGISNWSGFNPNVKSSIIALNSTSELGPDVYGPFVSAGFNLIGQTDNSTGFTAATDLTGTTASPRDPGLDPEGARNNGGPTVTVALMPDSPAIDKGTHAGLTGTLTTDQRGSGFMRTVDDTTIANASGGDGTDIGAFEYFTIKLISFARAMSPNTSDVVVTFQATQGGTYRLQRKLATSDSTWQSINGVPDFTAAATGSAQITDTSDPIGLGKAFYRVVQL